MELQDNYCSHGWLRGQDSSLGGIVGFLSGALAAAPSRYLETEG